MLSKQQLGNLLWGMADTGLRGKVEDYKAYILSLLFFKRLSDNYEWETEFRIREFTENYGSSPSPKQRERIRSEGHDFIIPEGCFWKDVRSAETSEKNDKLNSCVQAIAEVFVVRFAILAVLLLGAAMQRVPGNILPRCYPIEKVRKDLPVRILLVI
jgi:type I restriction enzyme M protein